MSDTIFDTAPPAPLPPGLDTAPAAPSSPAPVPGMTDADLERIVARLMMAQSRTPSQAGDAPKPRVRLDPSPNLGRPCVVWTDEGDEPFFALCTRELLDDGHPGYIDVVAFPPGKPAQPMISVPPKAYAWR